MKWLKNKLEPREPSAPRAKPSPHETAYAKTRRGFQAQYRWCVDATNMNAWDRVPNPEATDKARKRLKMVEEYSEARSSAWLAGAALSFFTGWFTAIFTVGSPNSWKYGLIVSGLTLLLCLSFLPAFEYWRRQALRHPPYLAVPNGVVHLCDKFDEVEQHIMSLKPSDEAIASLVTARASWNELVHKIAQYSVTGSINYAARQDCTRQLVDLLAEALSMEAFLHKRSGVVLGLTNVDAVESLMGPSVSAAQEAEWVQAYLDKLDSGDAVLEIEPKP